MKLTPTAKAKIYEAFQLKYYAHAKATFSWKKGEKVRLTSTFTRFADRCPETYGEEDVMSEFMFYLDDCFHSWSSWANGNRSNIIGFLSNDDRMATFIRKATNSATMQTTAGFNTGGDWDV